MTNLSVEQSPQMTFLLGESSICKRMAVVAPDIRAIFFQTVLDITNEGNRDTVGPTVLAAKNLLDVLELFASRGEQLLNSEK